MGQHLDTLLNSTDGPISPYALRDAHSADEAECRAIDKRRGCRVRPGSVRLTRKGKILRMARDIVAARAMKGEASASDLTRRGWSQQDILALGSCAVLVAARLWVGGGDAA